MLGIEDQCSILGLYTTLICFIDMYENITSSMSDPPEDIMASRPF